MIVMSWFELVQTLIQTIPFPMNIVDQKGNILFQNDVFKEKFGPEAIGKKCWELYRDDKKQCKTCPLKKPIEVGQSESVIAYGVMGGRVFEVFHTGMMFGGKKAMLEVFIDVTERFEMNDEIQRSEDRFRKLFGNMEQGFAVHEMIYDDNGKPIDYRYIMVNEAFETLTGLKGKNIINKTIKEVVPDVEDYWIEKFGEVCKTGKPMQFEGYFKYANKTFNVTAYKPENEQFAVVFYDVTQYKEDRETLEDRQKFTESVLAVCPSLIYVYDISQKKFVYANQTLEEILGYTCDELKEMGENIREKLMHPKDYDTYTSKIFPKYKRLRTGKIKHSYRMKHKNGKWVRMNSIEVVYKRDKDGKPIQIVGSITK